MVRELERRSLPGSIEHRNYCDMPRVSRGSPGAVSRSMYRMCSSLEAPLGHNEPLDTATYSVDNRALNI
jgi:hypothetical protein